MSNLLQRHVTRRAAMKTKPSARALYRPAKEFRYLRHAQRDGNRWCGHHRRSYPWPWTPPRIRRRQRARELRRLPLSTLPVTRTRYRRVHTVSAWDLDQVEGESNVTAAW